MDMDVFFSRVLNILGLSMCIRDNEGHFMLAKMEWSSPLLDVDLREALDLNYFLLFNGYVTFRWSMCVF